MKRGLAMCVSGVQVACLMFGAGVAPAAPSQGGKADRGKGRVKVAMAKRVVQPLWKKLVGKGMALTVSTSKRQRHKGMGLLLRAHRLAPQELEAMVGAARVYMLLGFGQPKRMARWGNRGWAIAKKMKQRWPGRAEGYLWSAIHIGLVAQGISPMSAFFRGLHKQIEKMAKASIQRDPSLYHGVAQRLLGRFFYKLPWPMKRMKQSRQYLSSAYRMAPYQPHGLLFYGETLKAMGQRYYAKRMFRRCAKAPLQQAFNNPAQLPVDDVVAQCRKQLK